MTKKQMVEAIQIAEAKAWKDLRLASSELGNDPGSFDPRIVGARREWSALYSLREEMGIPAMGITLLLEKGLCY